jgi:hypothetical protein
MQATALAARDLPDPGAPVKMRFPRRPGDDRAGLAAGLLCLQDGDPSPELLADRFQPREGGQLAQALLASAVF